MPSRRIGPVLIALTLAALLCAASLVGCAQTPPRGTPGITGTIKLVEATPDGVAVLIEGGEQPEGAVSDKAQVRVTDDTRVFAADGRAAKLEDLSVGANVKVWFDGAVAESYPVQGTAAAIQFVE